MAQLHDSRFEKNFVLHFPGDETGNRKPRQTPGVLWSKAVPTPVAAPKLLAWSEELAAQLGLNTPDEKDVLILGGNKVTDTMYPYAACYGGHQFGHWAGQLGDGRAITLGELRDPQQKLWELQLKGAGPTAYSRRADGRAVLRSSVREYLMSEAMHYLGVPTTRALSLVSTGDEVMRDMFYDGHPANEPGAIVMRVAPSFIRFGNFEILAARQETNLLRQLVNWTIDGHYPHLSGQDRVLQWFAEVVQRTAALMVEWMRVGFVHGVMNTDNLSILGLTIDYGPYSFVDDYDLLFTPNTTDLPGRRYAFGRQPAIGKWNLGCLANALVPLFKGATEELVKVLDSYDDLYWSGYYGMMGQKLGLDSAGKEEIHLISDMEKMMNQLHPDMTIFFQQLIELPLEIKKGVEWEQLLQESWYQSLSEAEQTQLEAVMNAYVQRIQQNKAPRAAVQEKQRAVSPRFVLRNYLLHQAIEGLEQGDDALFRQLEQALKEPYSGKHDAFFARRPDWAGQKAGCSMLSCSS
jgi:serine/tyrosine/threonine adenylyltransferase